MLQFPTDQVLWALGSICATHRIPFDAELVLKQFPPPHTTEHLILLARGLGFKVRQLTVKSLKNLMTLPFPCLIVTNPPVDNGTSAQPEQAFPSSHHSIALLAKLDHSEALALFHSGSQTPTWVTPEDLMAQIESTVFLLKPKQKPVSDPDDTLGRKKFGFSWFLPELLKHKKVWGDILAASLLIQLLALATPLFTQAVIDKVVIHRTESTLIAIAIGMGVFMIFSAILTWVRQYLVLHTGNRVDAVLGATVFDHLFKLPPRYFQYRPTGVIAARLHGVENIREFIASAGVTLILDLPFLLIYVAIMFYYSVLLTSIVLIILAIIVLISIAVAPLFQTYLSQQFLLGARNQAFLTEYISGLETVKSLQMEPQLKARYSDYLASYMQAGFKTKQIGNTYSVIANSLEQLMTLLILVIGAWEVMNPKDTNLIVSQTLTQASNLFKPSGTETEVFTIGMLIAFQMFAGKLSQPLLRLVGLWQQFQQARLSIARLGDIIDAPMEPYSVVPSRINTGPGKIEILDLAFRYADELPYLYKNLNLVIEPGKVIAVMGPSGVGKSTLAKMLQGFYLPTQGQIKIDGIDARHLSANELRNYFGVVPQETTLFSGTVYENLLMADPHATFGDIIHACKMAEIHAVIESLPKGYQTEIGERGAGLSGGQKQRIAIARALLKRPKILIFDEATSALDQQTAEHFAQTINGLKGKVTMLFITHAIPTSLQIDLVFQMQTPVAH